MPVSPGPRGAHRFQQCYAAQGRQPEALSAFAEDVYYCAHEYGPEDARTSLGYYNMGKVRRLRPRRSFT